MEEVTVINTFPDLPVLALSPTTLEFLASPYLFDSLLENDFILWIRPPFSRGIWAFVFAIYLDVSPYLA